MTDDPVVSAILAIISLIGLIRQDIQSTFILEVRQKDRRLPHLEMRT